MGSTAADRLKRANRNPIASQPARMQARVTRTADPAQSYLERLRWGDGFVCRFCGAVDAALAGLDGFSRYTGVISPRVPKPNGSAALVARKAMSALRLQVSRVPLGALGIDPFMDMHHLALDKKSPVIIDAGTNVGLSVHRFKHTFPSARIHGFEPSPTTYRQLCANVRRYSDLHTSNSALGAVAGEARLLENSHSDMSSLLPPGRLAWGEVARETTVLVDTVDDYSERNGLTTVDILKTDTQGFDLEVVKGASRLLGSHRLHLVYMELIFGAMYEGVPRCDDVLGYLFDRGFRLVCFYRFHFQEDVASWSDALFVDPSFAPA